MKQECAESTLTGPCHPVSDADEVRAQVGLRPAFFSLPGAARGGPEGPAPRWHRDRFHCIFRDRQSSQADTWGLCVCACVCDLQIYDTHTSVFPNGDLALLWTLNSQRFVSVALTEFLMAKRVSLSYKAAAKVSAGLVSLEVAPRLTHAALSLCPHVSVSQSPLLKRTPVPLN